PAVDRLDEPVDTVAEGDRQLPGQVVAHRVLRSIGCPGEPGDRAEIRERVIAEPAGQGLQVAQPAFVAHLAGRRDECVGGARGFEGGRIDLRQLVARRDLPHRGHRAAATFRREPFRPLPLPLAASRPASWSAWISASGPSWSMGTATARTRPAASANETSDRGTSGSPRITRARYSPVAEPLTLATFSGVPSAMIRPPRAPPSGPRSTIQSAVLMTSRLCSITTTVLPVSTSRCSTWSSFSTSAKWRPVVGSSRTYNVLPVA